MNTWRSTVLPVFISLLLHGMLAYFAFVGIELSANPVVVVDTPKMVQAKLVVLDKPKPKKKPKAKPKPTPKPTPKPKPNPEAKPRPPVKPQQPKPVEPITTPAVEPAKPVDPPEVEPDPMQAIKQQLETDQLAAIQEAMLAEQLLAESQFESEQVATYSALIISRVTQQWNRPVSAKKGMQVTLSLNLMPTGEVGDAIVTKSSGNQQFDDSALLAVSKIGRIPELAQMPSKIFENNFRQLTLLFNPKDLLH